MAKPNTVEIGDQVFAEIGARFPHLTMTRHPEDSCEISIRLAVQPGVKHCIWLALSNVDELHFRVEHFWYEWFPCTDSRKVSSYLDAVCGFLSGCYRVLEYLRNGDCIKAELQAPEGETWRTIAVWSKLRLPSFAQVQSNVVSNA
jgi:hypothetical protein